MNATLAMPVTARDLLPALAPVEKSKHVGHLDSSFGLLVGLAMAVFGALWVASTGPAAAEGDGCRMQTSVTCAAWTALSATGMVADTK